MVAIAEVESADKGNNFKKLCIENKIIVLSICCIVLGLLVGILLLLAIPSMLKKIERPYRLPNDILPYQYELEVKPYLTPGDFKFEGKVMIYVVCYKKTDSIVLHSRNLTIDEKSVKVRTVDGTEDFEVLLVDYDTNNDLLVIRLLEDLKERRIYQIYIEYDGVLRNEGEGFYFSSYEDEQNITHYVASTHFEPVSARKAFPCFDEPQLKSTFNITLVRWNNMTTLSNMPKQRTEPRGGYWEADIYKKSMKMSTYLVAFVFCDYVRTTKGKVTVWSPEHRKNNTEYALEVATKSLEFFEGKLGISYPGPKLDMVPVPLLLASGMENWGLIIYDEYFLLTPVNKSKETPTVIELITTVVSHEIAHQWFGNYVTMKWWSEVWLNEGIASYMENLAVAQILPDWHQVDPTVVGVLPSVPYDCSQATTVWWPVRNSEEANENFNDIIYSKGAMVTRMAHHILGDKIFWRGIKRYLITNAFENVEESDFWRHLTMAQLDSKENLDMEEIMHPWTHLSGIPIVTAHRDYNRREVIISQQSCKSDEMEHENDIWNIPMVFATKHSDNLFKKIIWLRTRNTTVGGMPEDGDWIAINTNATGYYIVNYDEKNWELLSRQLRSSHTIFQPTERYKLLMDILILESMNYVKTYLVFQHFLYIGEENESQILRKQIRFLHMYLHYFDDEIYHELMKEFVIHIWKKVYDRYGWIDEENIPRMLWNDVEIGLLVTVDLCQLGYDPCVQEALTRYEMIKKAENKTLEETNSNMLALCAVTGNATLEEWNSIKDQYVYQASSKLSLALMCANDEAIIQEELHARYDDTEVNLFLLLMSMEFDRKVAFDGCLNYVDNRFNTIPERDIELTKNQMELMKAHGKAIRIKQIIQLFTKHLENASGLKTEKMKEVLGYFNRNLSLWEKKERDLKRWLEKKPWKMKVKL